MKKEELSLNTMRHLSCSLKKFMTKKPFDKITITELLKDCDISRPTFYYHFEDIYGLLAWTFDTEVLELLKPEGKSADWENGLLQMLYYMKKNEKICLCAYNSSGWRTLESRFSQKANPLMLQFVSHVTAELPVNEEHAGFITEFYTSALIGCCFKWLSEGMKQEPEEISELIFIAMHSGIKAIQEQSAIKILE